MSCSVKPKRIYNLTRDVLDQRDYIIDFKDGKSKQHFKQSFKTIKLPQLSKTTLPIIKVPVMV